MKKGQNNINFKPSFKNEPVLKIISQTQNQADKSKTVSFSLQLFDKDSRDSSTSSGVSKTGDDLEDKTGCPNKRKKNPLTPPKEQKMPKVVDEYEDEIERQLDSKAEKTNLSVINVKNILKSVITNQDVLNMVRQSLNGEIECTYEPKLTRSKTKELLMMSPKLTLPPALALTPLKTMPSSECKALIDRDLPEDSSDEEYNPNEEEPVSEDDEDKEAASSIVSDLDSLPMTPASTQLHDTSYTDLLDDSVFVRPQENVGQRTRSKLSLNTLPIEVIEQSFVPPDITCDMYDSVCDNDDWSDFLKEFCQPLDAAVNETADDVEADPEYNVLADVDAETVDKEELRVDRAVKVSRKELNALMAEIREFTDLMSSEEDENINPSSFLPMSPTFLSSEEINGNIGPLFDEKSDDIKEEMKEEPVEESEENDFKNICFTYEQGLLLSQQLRQHVQLMTQHFLQTYKHPTLNKMASKCKENLNTLHFLGEGKKCTYFRPLNLQSALKTVSEWENLLDHPKKGQPIIKFMEYETEKGAKAKRQNVLYKEQFPKEMMRLVLQSKAFIYPLLLPPIPFTSVDRRPVIRFTRCENMLIALYLEQLIPHMKANKKVYKNTSKNSIAKLIVELNMPHGRIQSIAEHISKMKKEETSNPIKHYFDKLTAPKIQHFVAPVLLDVAFTQQPLVLFPERWRNYMLQTNTANYTNR